MHIRERLRSLKPYLQLCTFTCRLCQRGWRSISCSGASELGMGQLCCGHGVRHCWCCGQREESSCGKKSVVCLLVIINVPSYLTLLLFLKAHGDNPGKTTRVAVAVVDTFVWQALASVIIPGFTINRVCAASLYLLGRTTKWPLPVRKWTTTAIGLSTIPFIITPIDRLAQDACWCVFAFTNWELTQASSVTFNWDRFWKLKTWTPNTNFHPFLAGQWISCWTRAFGRSTVRGRSTNNEGPCRTSGHVLGGDQSCPCRPAPIILHCETPSLKKDFMEQDSTVIHRYTYENVFHVKWYIL